MAESNLAEDRFRKAFLLALAIAISLLFFAMIRGFLTALLIAAILSGITHPLYRRLRDSRPLRRLKSKEKLASLLTLSIVFLLIVLPLLGFAGLVVTQAVDISQAVRPWVEEQVSQPSRFDRLLQDLPFYDAIAPFQEQILEKAGQTVSRIGGFLVNAVATATRETAVLVFMLFVTLYAMFFFLIDGRRILDKILYYMPLDPEDEERMVEKFISVSRATLKGTLIIGVVQGGLAGLAFAVVGIKGAAFWGTVMLVLSIIPGVGTALIWVPAMVYLFVIGQAGAAIGLGIWCAAVVGTVDNLLRPWLVGKDTRMPDLLILLATLGGLVLFGALGIVIGPIVAALFVTVWDIYGVAFREYLPAVGPLSDRT